MAKEKQIKEKRNIQLKDYAGIIFFVLMFIVFSIFGNGFFTLQNIINVFRQNAVLGIVAVGMMMCILTGGLDLSVGAMVGAAGMVAAHCMMNLGMSSAVSSIIAVVVCGIVGVINGLIITKLKISPLIATLATMTITRGICYSITKSVPIYGLPESFKFLGQYNIWGIIPVSALFMVAIFLLAYIVLNKLPIGRYIYGVGGNTDAVRLAGVNVDSVKMFVYTVTGVLTGFAGIIYLSRVNSALPAAAESLNMDVITGVILGGVSVAGGEGRLSGAFIGIMTIGFLTNGLLIVGVPEYYQYFVKGIVFILAVSLDTISDMTAQKQLKNKRLKEMGKGKGASSATTIAQ